LTSLNTFHITQATTKQTFVYQLTMNNEQSANGGLSIVHYYLLIVNCSARFIFSDLLMLARTLQKGSAQDD
jgi:hypothetical protein